MKTLLKLRKVSHKSWECQEGNFNSCDRNLLPRKRDALRPGKDGGQGGSEHLYETKGAVSAKPIPQQEVDVGAKLRVKLTQTDIQVDTLILSGTNDSASGA